MIIFGLNVFTACYGMPPGDLEPIPVPEEKEQTKAPAPSDEDIDESDEAENDGFQLN